jgi:hypothetical protein
VNDRGNTGAGGPLTNTSAFAIMVFQRNTPAVIRVDADVKTSDVLTAPIAYGAAARVKLLEDRSFAFGVSYP